MHRYLLPILTGIVLTFTTGCKNDEKNDLNPTTNSTAEYENPEWAVHLIEAYEAFNANRDLESAHLVFDASEEMPVKNWENFLVCAMVFAENGAHEESFLAIDRAVTYGLKDSELLKSIPEFKPLNGQGPWDTLIQKTHEKYKAYRSNIHNPGLLKELEYLWHKDQQALSEYEQNISLLDGNASGDDYKKLFEPVEERWQINKKKLDSILEIHGWPDDELVGEEGSKIAWAIAQHHPDIFFKKKCLRLMEKKVAEGAINPNHFAELNDRIARDTWQKQTYGASMGNQKPHPINSVSQVNKRRIALGLPEPIEVYALYHGISYSIPDNDEVRERYAKAQSDYTKFESKIRSGGIEPAIAYLRKAIDAHGDLSNEQLFDAAKKLALTEQENAHELGLRILKVLIWREWAGRFGIVEEPDLNSLKNRNEWGDITELLERSKT